MTQTHITPAEQAIIIERLDHSGADLHARKIGKPDGPITKFVAKLADPLAGSAADYILVEHGRPYWGGREGRAITLVVKRADNLWVSIGYEHNGSRWNLNTVEIADEVMNSEIWHKRHGIAQHRDPMAVWPVLTYTNSSAEWALTADIDNVRTNYGKAMTKAIKAKRKEVVTAATDKVARLREQLAAAEAELKNLS